MFYIVTEDGTAETASALHAHRTAMQFNGFIFDDSRVPVRPEKFVPLARWEEANEDLEVARREALEAGYEDDVLDRHAEIIRERT